MAEVPSRELRNNTAAVLRRVQDGEEITITVRGKPVAEVVPVGSRRKGGLTFDELDRRLARIPFDPTFAKDMEWIKGEYTDEDPLPWE
ncbi:MAG TPA: type II toxin-antitoxin system prevent-host-death family antitoxin [Iamia sp.]|nr:type II toxin-antitoxin system prevent-host-death family antitoxin [Iamia sp.]